MTSEERKPTPEEILSDYAPEVLNAISRRVIDGQVVGTDPPTEERQNELLAKMVELYKTNPIEYDRQRKAVAKELCCNVAALDQQIKMLVEQSAPKALAAPEEDVAQELIDIGVTETKAIWHDPNRNGYATTEVADHLEHHKLTGDEFEDFLYNAYGERHKRLVTKKDGSQIELPIYPKQAAVNEAIRALQAHAKRKGIAEPKFRIGAWDDAEMWVDLGREEWDGIKVTGEGWKYTTQLRVPFHRNPSMRALPIPQRGGDIRDLRKFVNVHDEDFVLYCGCLAGLFNPWGDFSTTIFCGPTGSGKTTATRIARLTADPNEVDIKPFNSVRDVEHGIAEGCHVVAFDNVSSISADQSDTICRLNTGTGFAERKYYAQGKQFTARLKCPVLLSGIAEDLAERDDLISRTVTIVFPMMEPNSYRSDAEFKRDFEPYLPSLLGVLLDGASAAIRNRDKIGEILGGYRPRLSDFVMWAECACRAMGFAPGEFTEAYRNNQDRAHRYLAETNPVIFGIKRLIDKYKHWEGAPEQLHSALNVLVTKKDDKDRLPKNASSLVRGGLPRAKPVLLKLYGIKVETGLRLENDYNRNGNGIRISLCVPSVPSVTISEKVSGHSEDTSTLEETSLGKQITKDDEKDDPMVPSDPSEVQEKMPTLGTQPTQPTHGSFRRRF